MNRHPCCCHVRSNAALRALAILLVAAAVAVSVAADEPLRERFEDGCLDGRAADYLQRHGLDGALDPEQRLSFIRDFMAKREREQQSSRHTAASVTGSTWTSLGPANGAGRATSISFHPTVAGTMLLGAAGGGVWRSANGGSTWSPLTDSIPDLSVGAVAYAPSDPMRIYAGTGEGGRGFGIIPGIGLLYSGDGGATWALPSSVIASSFYRLSIHPANPNDLVAATSSGLLRSTGGQNGPWALVLPFAGSGATPGYGVATDLVRDPSNPSILYATSFDDNQWCARNGCGDPNYWSPRVVKSIDDGATWSEVMNGLPVSTTTEQVGRIAIALAPSSPSTLYAAMLVENDVPRRSRVYKTTDGGASWTRTASDPPFYFTSMGMSSFANALVVSPADANKVYAGGVDTVMTTDGGVTWSYPVDTYNHDAATYVHADCHELRYDSSGNLWSANDGGIYRIAPNGTVTPRNDTLVTREFYTVAQDPVNRDRLLGGQQDNGTSRRLAAGMSWDWVLDGDGFDCVFNEETPDLAFGSWQFNEIRRTARIDDPNLVWVKKSPINDPSEFVPFWTKVVPDPSRPSTVYAITARVWKSTTAGEAWVPLPTTTTGGGEWDAQVIQSMAIAPSNPQVLMVGKLSLYYSSDGGTTWAQGTGWPPFRRINAIAIDPANPSVAFAALAGSETPSVYYTTNGGASWSGRGNGLPSFSALSIRFDPTDSQTLYAGTEVGLYRSTDGGANWALFGAGLPHASIYDIAITADGTALRVATYGRGIWQLEVTTPTNVPPVVTAASSPSGSPLRIALGTRVTFSGTFSDPDGDAMTAKWVFPDDYSSRPVASGAPIPHIFRRAGRFPVTLSVRDAKGGLGAKSVDVIVVEPSDNCATAPVIPGAGPFPYTVGFTNEAGTAEGTDPQSGPGCVSQYTTTNWFSFTPASSGSYGLSLCGSMGSAQVNIATAPASCGPYTLMPGVCPFRFPSQYAFNFACGADATVSLNAGTTYYLFITNALSRDAGQQQLTIAPAATPLTPVAMHVAPRSGRAAGGESVAITGGGFIAGATVSFGGTAATNVNVVTPNIITATVPPHNAGSVDLVVTGGGLSTLQRAYTYNDILPPAIVAVATGGKQVTVTIAGVADADQYQIFRGTSSTSFSLIDTIASAPDANGSQVYLDNGVSADSAYLYKVRSVSGGVASMDSNLDLATTTIFTNDPIATGTTILKAAHVLQLRAAVGAVRKLAALPVASFTDPSLAGVRVKAVHINELRNALDPARAALALTPLSYSSTLTGGTSLIRAVHVTELRNGVK